MCVCVCVCYVADETGSSPFWSFKKEKSMIILLLSLVLVTVWPFPLLASCQCPLLPCTISPVLPRHCFSAALNFPLIHILALLLLTLFPFIKVFSLPESHPSTLASLANSHSRSASNSLVMTWLWQSQSFLSVSTTLLSYFCCNIHFCILVIICLYACLHLDSWLLQTRESVIHVYILDAWYSIRCSLNIC